MAGLKFYAASAEIATGTSAKTLVQIVAAANHRVLIREVAVSFDGTSNTGDPIQCKLIRQSDAGTMSSLTLQKVDADDDETLQTTAQHTSTSEPTGTTVIKAWQVHPQAGLIWQASFGEEIVINGGDRLGLVVTSGADVNALVSMTGEE